MRKDAAVCFFLPDCHVPGIRPLIAAYLMLLLLVAGWRALRDVPSTLVYRLRRLRFGAAL